MRLLLQGISRAKQYCTCFIIMAHQQAMKHAVSLLDRFMFLTFCQGLVFFLLVRFNSGVKVE